MNGRTDELENVDDSNDAVMIDKVNTNGWNKSLDDTLKSWQKDVTESSFVYGEKLESNEKLFKTILILTLIFGAIMTSLTALNAALIANEVNKWAVFSIEIILFIGSALVTVLTGAIHVLELEETMKVLTKFIQKLDNQWAVFQAELSLPWAQRLNGEEFIKRVDRDYMHLMQQSPHISTKDFFEYKQSYINQIVSHREWQKEIDKKLSQLDEVV